MSAAAAESVASQGDATPGPRKGRKKLIVIAAAALVLLAGAGGGAAWMLKQKRAAAAAAEAAANGEEEATPAAHAQAQRETRKTPPAFLPLEAFVVNLADRDSERFAQIGITLELDDAKVSDQLKAYMPAIRNGILMVLAHKTSQELLTRSGKQKLASEIMREAVRPLGVELEDENEEAKADDRHAKTPLDQSPVRHVHFSSFIIQ
ncbi:flagellar basal body-associated FliL family protein [Piscinibacter sp. XHJ-5]|uniref:flagellar basal body-associated FliL family protein n=1 Tax=Piscinibacter sp. XHJ-5 TaxID=3037797 RepID=UPI002452F264|nr:flagellar basal body-associated FliL family protein [Piscinibacter sp. XHJ-5]